MPASFAIPDTVRDVLAACTIDATSVRLNQQLDRKLYVQVDKVLKAAGGKWDRKAGAHLFPQDPRAALGLAIQTGKATNHQQALQAFYTPPALAARVVALADIQPGHLVLEPSAGQGALCRAIKAAAHDAALRCWELDTMAADGLRAKGYNCTGGDFLTSSPAPVFDRVVMNPPFTKGQDIAHVTHALKYLKPGGRLVAITSPTWRTRSTKAAEAFRSLVQRYSPDGEPHIEDVPPGSFAESGTNVSTILLVLLAPR